MQRRSILKGTLAAALGLLARGSAYADDAEPKPTPKAKSLIVLFMNGGASHVDTFDPKPNNPFKAIPSATPGISVCEHLPQIAARARDLAIVRGMTSKEGNHERARFFGHTGYAPNPTVDHPSLASWISAERGGEGTLPAFISIGGPSAGAGFLGMEHGPFVMRDAGALPDNVAPGLGVSRERLNRRLDGLDFVEKRFFDATKDASVASRQKIYSRALRMMRGDDLAAFDLASEPAATRRAYGESDFGRGCLLARRLVESGTRVVEVTQNGWDTHFDGVTRSKKLMGDLDPAMATLLSDLKERDLFDSTLVLWMGDFGRSPRVNARDGRGHHPRAWTAVLAGGGLRGGVVHGATDATGNAVVDKPTSVPDLFATVARQMGLDPQKSVATPSGRPISVTDQGVPIHDIIA